MKADLIIDNVYVADFPAAGRYGDGILKSVAIRGEKILSIRNAGSNSDANCLVIDGQQQWLSPGLIDCHSHLVYGGQRADEFELKLGGTSYETIARAGGGIKSTVKATRELEEDVLFEVSSRRLKTLLKEGITCIEIKSGYGLNLKDELKMLRVARRLGETHPVTVRTSFLGAHALPDEFHSRDDYIGYLIQEVLPTIAEAKLADAVDFFCEGIGFSLGQCERICIAAGDLGLPVKGHVEQLSYLQGAKLVAKYKGLSADHLEYLQFEDIAILKDADVVAVLLPGAFYNLSETQLPPIEAMLDQGLSIAIGTDLNPGSSPIASMLNIMNLACIQFKLRPVEVLKAVTCHAAKALGMDHMMGAIKPGFNADLVLWPIETPAELCYGMNLVSPSMIIKGGKHVGPLG